MRDTLIVGLGGAIGSLLRFELGLLFPTSHMGAVASLLVINGLGSILIGFIMIASVELSLISQQARLFLTSGVMGGFTTFSGFAVLVATLLHVGATMDNLLLVAGHLILAIVAPFGGMALARLWTRLLKGGVAW